MNSEFANEAAAAMNHVLDVRREPKVRALIASANASSLRVAERLGLIYEADTEIYGKVAGIYTREQGRRIDTEKAPRKENAINGVASLVPRSWELVSRARQGEETVLATNVANYDLLADGSVIYSNGRAIFTLDRGGQSSLLLKEDLVGDIVGRRRVAA